jgi:hypothetical protein
LNVDVDRRGMTKSGLTHPLTLSLIAPFRCTRSAGARCHVWVLGGFLARPWAFLPKFL